MHYEALQFLLASVPDDSPSLRILEIGSRDINGSPRQFFLQADYYGIDVQPGRGVDQVINGVNFDGRGVYDLVICAETLEHATDPSGLIASMFRALRPGGLALVTAAAPGRMAHSAIDGGEIRDAEHYRNIPPDDLRKWLEKTGFVAIDIRHNGQAHDVYASARKDGGSAEQDDPHMPLEALEISEPVAAQPKKRGRKRAS